MISCLQQKANIYNEKIIGEFDQLARKKILAHIESSNHDLKTSDLTNVFNIAKQSAMEEVCESFKENCLRIYVFFNILKAWILIMFQYDKEKMGNAEISSSCREKLTHSLDNFHSILSRTIETNIGCETHYSNSMQTSLDQVEYFRQDDFVNLHQRVKSEAVAQV